VPNGTAPFRHTPSSSRQLLIDTAGQRPANPMPTSRDDSSVLWHTFVNNSVATNALDMPRAGEGQASDRDVLQSSTPEATAAPTNRLIEISPKRTPVSRNMNLLIDLDVNSPAQTHAASSRRAPKADMNLLD
jgi:hypothetical protein